MADSKSAGQANSHSPVFIRNVSVKSCERGSTTYLKFSSFDTDVKCELCLGADASEEKVIARLVLLYAYEVVRQHFVSRLEARSGVYLLSNPTAVAVLVGLATFTLLPQYGDLANEAIESLLAAIIGLVSILYAVVVAQAPLRQIVDSNIVGRSCYETRWDFNALMYDYFAVNFFSLAALFCVVVATINIQVVRLRKEATRKNMTSIGNVTLEPLSETEQAELTRLALETFESFLIAAGITFCYFLLVHFYLVVRANFTRNSRASRSKELNIKYLPVKDEFDVSDMSIVDYLVECRMLHDLGSVYETKETKKETNEKELCSATVVLLPGNKTQIDERGFGTRVTVRANQRAFRRSVAATLCSMLVHKGNGKGKGVPSVEPLPMVEGDKRKSTYAREPTEAQGETDTLKVSFIGSIFELENSYNWKEMLKIAREHEEIVEGYNTLHEELTKLQEGSRCKRATKRLLRSLIGGKLDPKPVVRRGEFETDPQLTSTTVDTTNSDEEKESM